MTARLSVPVALLSVTVLSLLIAAPGQCGDIRLKIDEAIRMDVTATANQLPADRTLLELLGAPTAHLGNAMKRGFVSTGLADLSKLKMMTSAAPAAGFQSLAKYRSLELDPARGATASGRQFLRGTGLRLAAPAASPAFIRPGTDVFLRSLEKQQD